MGTRNQQDPPVAPPVQRPFTMERETKGGRTLLYRATILQEPERARACGSGSKSTNDRRPVDPPPVVELRIFDVTPGREQRDITFTYNANFFIFTSLKLARPMAHGRVQTPAATSPPVLTGVPCSGIAYLDRPEEAGYFLFPDLSVRHEGRYKLAFTLYEETKEPSDFDIDDNDPQETQHFCFRMEIESEPFTVYSAKKFPGLTESTALSRNLSDQGVRVRIRRDVRMRRRDGKGGGGGGDAQKAEGEYARRQARSPERQPPVDHYRQRSLSATSEHGRMMYDATRRPSGTEYPPPPAPPPVGYPKSSATGNLNFNQAPGPQYGAHTPIGTPHPSPTTPTFAPSHPSPMQTPTSHYGPPTIKAESPHPRQHHPIPPSPHQIKPDIGAPRRSHQLSLSKDSIVSASPLPPINMLIERNESIPSSRTLAPLQMPPNTEHAAVSKVESRVGPGKNQTPVTIPNFRDPNTIEVDDGEDLAYLEPQKARGKRMASDWSRSRLTDGARPRPGYEPSCLDHPVCEREFLDRRLLSVYHTDGTSTQMESGPFDKERPPPYVGLPATLRTT